MGYMNQNISLCKDQKNTEKDNARYIYVLLLRYPDLYSTTFRFFSRCRYSHASIGVSDSDGMFYSYVTKGFRIEHPEKYPTFKEKEVPCKLYRVEVSDEIYNKTKAMLDNHQKESYKFKYNLWGVVLCYLKVVYPLKNRYFCSQFVSEILGQMQAISLKKHSALYMPDDFTKVNELDLCFSGPLSQLAKRRIYAM